MARQKKDEAVAKTESIKVWVSKAELKEIHERAGLIPISTFIRSMIGIEKMRTTCVGKEKRTNRLMVSFSDGEMERLELQAKGIPVPVYIRTAMIQDRSQAPRGVPEINTRTYVELGDVAKNLAVLIDRQSPGALEQLTPLLEETFELLREVRLSLLGIEGQMQS